MVCNIKKNLLGALEIALFLKSGATRFTDCTQNFKTSFIWPLLLLPLTLMIVFTAHPNGELANHDMQVLAIIYTLRLFVYLGLFLGFVYIMAKTMDKACAFKRFATANNYLTIPAACFMIPLFMMFLSGNHAWETIYPMMVVVTLYSYAYSAFMAAHVLRIPYELAGFIAIAGMAIHQTSLSALKWAAIQTLQLVA